MKDVNTGRPTPRVYNKESEQQRHILQLEYIKMWVEIMTSKIANKLW